MNRYGSFFYGSLLGVFILAILTKRATATGAFWGIIAGMAVVLTVAFTMPWIAFLWHNLIGAVVVVVVGMAISYTQPAPTPRSGVDLRDACETAEDRRDRESLSSKIIGAPARRETRGILNPL